tara:strand:- start:29 stop:1444 length:1416 start_codon:yes stop_codon:yes gene_type:complete
MVGGYVQLVSHGSQDVYLTGNPQITYFKIVYKRYTNFAIESIKNDFNETPSLGSTSTSKITRNGDLIYRMYVQSDITINDSSGNGGWPGESMLKEVSLEIGGQLIDKHYSDWIHIWNQLTLTDSKKKIYNKMIGHSACVVDGTQTSGYSNTDNTPSSGSTYTVNVPLHFWFCRNPGLALPLIALQYHEVKVKIAFADTQTNDGNSSVDSIANTNLYVDYIFLDKDERKRFAQVPHEYLIEQLQYTGEKTINAGESTATIKLNYNHPVKEIVWVVHQNRTSKDGTATTLKNRQTFGMYTDVSGSSLYSGGTSDYDTFIRKGEILDASGGSIYVQDGTTSDTQMRSTCEEITYHPAKWPTEARAPVKDAQILLNGQARISVRKGTYFSQTQVFECHSGSPHAGIYVFSFALQPEEHQPSGTCNFSRIELSQLKLTLKGSAEGLEDVERTARVYAVGYNIFRITNGMGGIVFNN